MYSQHIGLNGSTVEMCNSTGTVCGLPGSTTHPRGRVGAREAQYNIVWSTLLYDVENRYDLTWDQTEIYIRGEQNAARPPCCPPPFEVANNWMTEYPKAHAIPVGAGQRSDAEANRLVQWLLDNGIEVHQTTADFKWGTQKFEKGSYVVYMTQPRRGLANTALGIGDDISASITQLYAPPAAWSHGYLWGADIVTIPRNANFHPQRRLIKKPGRITGGVDRGQGRPVRPGDRLADGRPRSQRARRLGRGGADRTRALRRRRWHAPGRQRRLRGRQRHEGEARRRRQGARAALQARQGRVAPGARPGRPRAPDRRADGPDRQPG